MLVEGLNPCCSGRWSRTRPYKTILIINKLKNSAKQFFTFLNRKLTFLQRVQRYDYFSKYASQLFLNIQPFLSQKFNSVNQIGRQKPKDKRQDHPPNHYSALTNIRKRRLSPTTNHESCISITPPLSTPLEVLTTTRKEMNA